MTTLTQDCKALEKQRELKRTAKAEAEKQAALFADMERKLMVRMEAEDAESHRAAGKNYTPTKMIYGQIQDRAAFLEWAQAQSGEDDDPDETLYEIKERKGLVSELVRQRMDDGEPLPPGVTFYVKEYVSTTAS